jgi:hypothetical protein
MLKGKRVSSTKIGLYNPSVSLFGLRVNDVTHFNNCIRGLAIIGLTFVAL